MTVLLCLVQMRRGFLVFVLLLSVFTGEELPVTVQSAAGLTLSSTPPQRVYIAAVQPGSWPEREGMKLGDELLILNDKLIVSLSSQTFMQLLQAPLLKFRVRRPSFRDVDERRYLRISVALNDKMPDAPPLLQEALVTHKVEKIPMPWYIPSTQDLKDHCEDMQASFVRLFGPGRGKNRRSLFHVEALQRIEQNRGKLHRPLSLFEVQQGYVTLDGMVFDDRHLYLWEAPVISGEVVEVVDRQGLAGTAFALQQLGLLTKIGHKTNGDMKKFGFELRLRDVTGHAVLTKFNALNGEGENLLKSAFLLASLTSFSKKYTDMTCEHDVVSEHRCVVVVQQAFSINFSHFMVEVLPKLVHAISNREVFAELQQDNCEILLYRTPFAVKYVEVLQIPESQVLWYNPCKVYRGDRVLIFNPLAREHFLREQADAVRNYVDIVHPAQGSTAASAKRALIFDSRELSTDNAEQARFFVITNVKNVRGFLQKAAALTNTEFVEYIDFHKWTLRDTIDLYRRAEEIVALHGAGCMNALFAQACTRFLEITAENGPHTPLGCGISHSSYLTFVRSMPYISLVVEGDFEQPVSVSLPHLAKAMAKVRHAEGKFGCTKLTKRPTKWWMNDALKSEL